MKGDADMKLALALFLGFVSVNAFGDAKTDKKVFKKPILSDVYLDMTEDEAKTEMTTKCEQISTSVQNDIRTVNCFGERITSLYTTPIATMSISDGKVIAFNFVIGNSRAKYIETEKKLADLFKRKPDRVTRISRCWGDIAVKTACISGSNDGKVLVQIKNEEVMNKKQQ